MNTGRISNGILYALMSVVAVSIGMVSRRIATSAGASDTEVAVVFWCVIVLCAVIYFSFKLLIYNAFNWFFSKYAPKAKEVEIVEEPSPTIEKTIIKEVVEKTEQPIEPEVEIEEEEVKAAPIPEVEPIPMLDPDKIRQEKAVQKRNELQKQIKIAHLYTERILVLHINKEAMEDMLHNINIYATNGDSSELRAIYTKDLRYYDIFHYGWNIWNHFGGLHKQEVIAIFLKAVFSKDLKNFDTLKGITGKLKMKVHNATIEICEKLTAALDDTIKDKE